MKVGIPLILLLVGGLVLLVGLDYWAHPRRFTQEAWRSHPDGRQYMGEDLVKTRALLGMSERQVITLLGKPTGTTPPDSESGKRLTWYLGPERSLFSGLDGESLSVDLDVQGKVSAAESGQD